MKVQKQRPVFMFCLICVGLGLAQFTYGQNGGGQNDCLPPSGEADAGFSWEYPPDCEYAKYTVEITSPNDGASIAVGSGDTAQATAEREASDSGKDDDEDNRVTDETANITWSGDVSGSGGTSSDFTTSTGSKTLTASYNGISESIVVTVVGVKSVEGEGVTSETDTPGDDETIFVIKGESGDTITLTATPDPEDADPAWPSGEPTWTGGGVVDNNDGTASFPIDATSSSNTGTTVTVSCGTSSKAIIIVVYDVVFTSLSADGTPAELQYGTNENVPGLYHYFTQVALTGSLTVNPADMSLDVQLSQYLGGNGHTSFGDQVGGPVPTGADFEYTTFSHDTETGVYSGSNLDQPGLDFDDELEIGVSTPIVTDVLANVYLEWKLPTDTAWNTLGKVEWHWDGGLSHDTNEEEEHIPTGGISDETGAESSETPVNPSSN